MNYHITGRHIDIGDQLKEHVRGEIDSMLDKYAGRPTDATITFSRSGHGYVTEIVVHLSTGLTVNARGSDDGLHAAFDKAIGKADKQLRRYKRRLKDHHHKRADPVELSDASSYILSASRDDESEEPDTLQPVIVAETETKIPSLSVGEAVMQMELAGAPVLVFRHEGGNRVNVVYRRDDGNIGWIDPAT